MYVAIRIYLHNIMDTSIIHARDGRFALIGYNIIMSDFLVDGVITNRFYYVLELLSLYTSCLYRIISILGTVVRYRIQVRSLRINYN